MPMNLEEVPELYYQQERRVAFKKCLHVRPSSRERLGSCPCALWVRMLHSERKSLRQEAISIWSFCVRRAPAGCRAEEAWLVLFSSPSLICSCRVRFCSISSWFWTDSWNTVVSVNITQRQAISNKVCQKTHSCIFWVGGIINLTSFMAVWSSNTFCSLASTSSLRAWELFSSWDICSSKACRHKHNICKCYETIKQDSNQTNSRESVWRDTHLDLGAELLHHPVLLLNDLQLNKTELLNNLSNFIITFSCLFFGTGKLWPGLDGNCVCECP